MAYYHARANICRAGVTHAGLAHHPFKAVIGSTDRTSAILYDQFSVTTALDGSPSTCAFRVQGFTPTKGNDVLLTLGGELIWGGTLTETRVNAQKFTSGAVYTDCQAIDWTWLMDRYSRVDMDVPVNMAVNQLVASILRNFTDGGFRPGYIPSDLTPVGPMSISGETVSTSLRRIAATTNAYCRLRAGKYVDMFTTLPSSNALTLGNSSDIRRVVYQESLSQVRTRTFYIGASSTCTTATSYGATSIDVDECALFSGTLARVGNDFFSYSGRSVAQGPGSLTGVTGLAVDIAQGEIINVASQVDDVTAQTALAAVLGGSRSGIAVGWFNDDRLSQSESTARATADVEAFKDAIPSLGYTTTKRFHEPGKTVAVTFTDPITVSDTFRIQRVTMTPYGAVVGNTPSFQYHVECRVFRRADILDQ